MVVGFGWCHWRRRKRSRSCVEAERVRVIVEVGGFAVIGELVGESVEYVGERISVAMGRRPLWWPMVLRTNWRCKWVGSYQIWSFPNSAQDVKMLRSLFATF